MKAPLPPPCDLGAPAKYDRWRNGQDKAMRMLLKPAKRFEVLALPTGVGKSLVSMTYGLLTGLRMVYLTSTRGLQDQIRKDYKRSGAVDVRGMGNYPCLQLDGGFCDDGPCLDGDECEFKESGCLYFDQVRDAQTSQIVVTNYSFWFSMISRHQGLGAVDVLICDEAHEIPDEMGRFLRLEFSPGDVYFPPGADNWNREQWSSWATVTKVYISDRIRGVPRHERKKLRRIKDDLETLKIALTGSDRNHWVIEKVYSQGGSFRWTFEPIWPRKFMRDWLWGDIPLVVLSSATIRPKTLEMMGLKPEDYRYLEIRSPLPVERRPVIHIPTVRMSHKTNEGDIAVWVARMDQIIRKRLDRKGIIHAVSYRRARDIVARSEFRDIMILHDSNNARDVIEAFKKGDAPQILVSPSVHTGWDFPYEAASYQIIAKIPFPDTRGRMMEARTAEDKAYPMYMAMMGVVQAAGRVMRAPDDIGETFIVDDNAKWFIARYRRFAPQWFMQAYESSLTIPDPPLLPGLRQALKRLK